MQRPNLNRSMSVAAFKKWYWLKSELLEFCGELRISKVGSKPDVAARIVAELEGKALPTTKSVRRSAAMPEHFGPDTVIAEGWRCNPQLGNYFRATCGKGFRFNAAMREFIHTRVGCTLSEAAECYVRSIAVDAPRQPIIAQNQYNLHTREFYRENPGATRQQVIEAWKAKRANGTV